MPHKAHSAFSFFARRLTVGLAAIGALLMLAKGSVAFAVNGGPQGSDTDASMSLRRSVAQYVVKAVDSQATQDPRARTRDSVGRARDSVRALRVAQDAVQVHHYRFSLYMEPPTMDWMQASAFTCEMSVYPYCFGPMNGDVPFGQTRKAFPVEFRTWDPMVPDFLRRTVNRLGATMMRALDDAAAKVPGDRWITGQRSFQRVQSGDIHGAQAVARECRAEVWWCAALFGYTSYLLDQHGKADSAFSATLAALNDQERCNWENVGDLVYGDRDRDWYMMLSCGERVEVNRTLWWLADPLYITPGNERLTAHYYREIFLRLFADSNEELPHFTGSSFMDPATRTTGSGRSIASRASVNLAPPLACTMFEREVWQQASLTSLIRSLGVPAYFMLQKHPQHDRCPERPPLPLGTPLMPMNPLHDPRILLQYQQPTYHFLPNLVAVRAPMLATNEMWEVHDSNAVERYKPSFGTFSLLDHQVAWFRRGDSARMVAATDLAVSGLVSNRANQLVSSALVLSRRPGDIRMFRDTIPGTNATFFSAVPPESTIVSIEQLVPGVGAARARFASGPPPMPTQRVTLSDILLVERAAQELPRTLDSAARWARPSNSVSSATPLGIFWEVYGLALGDSVSASITVTETARSAAVAIGRFLGVLGAQMQNAVEFSETISSSEAIAPRSIALDLRSLNPGAYVLRLAVSVPGQDTVRVSREIQVSR